MDFGWRVRVFVGFLKRQAGEIRRKVELHAAKVPWLTPAWDVVITQSASYSPEVTRIPKDATETQPK